MSWISQICWKFDVYIFLCVYVHILWSSVYQNLKQFPDLSLRNGNPKWSRRNVLCENPTGIQDNGRIVRTIVLPTFYDIVGTGLHELFSHFHFSKMIQSESIPGVYVIPSYENSLGKWFFVCEFNHSASKFWHWKKFR